MIPLTAEEAGRALGLQALSAAVLGISIDTRTLTPGDLFVALKGERLDGHDFVEKAFAAGASGVVVARESWGGREIGRGGRLGGRPDVGTASVYEVDDTLMALWALAREVRRKSDALVFAVTGSVGKTSTKDYLGAMVGRVRCLVMTAANQNNEVGVPLTLLAVTPDTEAVVVEMGMRGLGQIAALAEVTEPDIGVITNIHPVHLELLGSLDNIAKAKAELAGGLRRGAPLVIPAECSVLQPYIGLAERPVVRFGLDRPGCAADVRGSLRAAAGEAEHVLSLIWPGGQVEVKTRRMARHQVENATAAAAACYAAGLPVAECAAGIAMARLSDGRGDVVRLPGLTIIDDTYNANPAAVRAALDDLVDMAGLLGGRAVAVLGDMLELGPEAERYHFEIGEYAGRAGVRALWGVGELSALTVAGFQRWWEGKTGDVDWRAGHVTSAEETSSVSAALEPGDIVLFKASRSMRLETMVRRLVAERRPTDEDRLVVERGPGDETENGTKETRRC
ncbi:MAG: UDP-N-acetylmuramoyl-tripeptide--D-alanyl-D-alanine ligase [Actinobacteria bacterium]|jgi:UDP-N-acetylmuramoyl-tripeptide--D-alanyl-D-alanine ligase|nr:UDP-N-acetylmuramoyl-tripeptide--D-alanyl-D-alanine ligase [Actinomycetota bacterium]